MIDTLVRLLIRLCQGGLGHSLQSGSIGGLSTEVKSSLNVPQSESVSKLNKAHDHELVPVSELNGMSVALVTVDALF